MIQKKMYSIYWRNSYQKVSSLEQILTVKEKEQKQNLMDQSFCYNNQQTVTKTQPTSEINLTIEFDFDEFCQVFYEDNHANIESPKIQENSLQYNFQDAEPKQSEGKMLKRKRNRKKLAYHNFQKHLVTTIRKHLKLRQLKKRGDASSLTLEIWAIFMKEKVYTKELLLAVLGCFKDERKEKWVFEKYNINNLLARYSLEEWEQTNRYLRERVIESLNLLDDERLTYKRRIKKDFQFVKYVREFVQELSQITLASSLNFCLDEF